MEQKPKPENQKRDSSQEKKDTEAELTKEKKEELSRDFNKYIGSFHHNQSEPPIFKGKWLGQGEIDFKELVDMGDNEKEYGDTILNRETTFLDYESLGEPEIFNPNSDEDYKNWLQKTSKENTICSVAEYVHKVYGDVKYLPGVEYQKYLIENKEIPNFIVKNNLGDFYLPGSLIIDNRGKWSAFTVYASGNQVSGSFNQIDGNWGNDDYIVFFDKKK
jgi:hypothetical protein